MIVATKIALKLYLLVFWIVKKPHGPTHRRERERDTEKETHTTAAAQQKGVKKRRR